jgi:hypothetical protein
MCWLPCSTSAMSHTSFQRSANADNYSPPPHPPSFPSTYDRIKSRSQSELAFSRLKMVVDLEKTLYMLPCPILRMCGFRYVAAQTCSDGSMSPACIVRSTLSSNYMFTCVLLIHGSRYHREGNVYSWMPTRAGVMLANAPSSQTIFLQLK